jgi:hypothetical protein
MPSASVFPSTDRTDLVAKLQGGPDERLQAIRLLLSLYLEPLVIYARGSSLRSIAEPVDLVQGFMADRLLRDEYLLRWSSSGMELRRWLINGLHLYAKEWIRSRRATPGLDKAADIAQQHVPQAEAAWARVLLNQACERVEEELRTSGHPMAWEIFRRHFIDGKSYAKLRGEFDLHPASMAESSRRVASLLRENVRLLLVREGVAPADVDHELRLMLRAVEEHR